MRQVRKKERKKIKLGWLSNSPQLPTGFSKVTREVCTRLAIDPHYEVHIIGENHIGRNQPWNHCMLHGIDRNKFKEEVEKIVKELDLDILMILEDSFTLSNLNLQHARLMPTKLVLYLPLDGWGVCAPPGLDVLRKADAIIPMATFTSDILKDEKIEPERTILHGVDLELFQPVSKKKQNELKKRFGFQEDDILIFNYGVNRARKANTRLLEAVYLAVENNPKIKLLAHMAAFNLKDGDLADYTTRYLLNKYGSNLLNKNIFFTTKECQDKVVAEMIQASDFTVSSTSGEGSGLLAPESMACCKPHVTTDYSTANEWLIDESRMKGKRGEVAKVESLHVSSYNTEHAFVDVKDLASKILDMVKCMKEEPKKFKEYGENGRRFVEKFCDWDVLVEEFKEVIERVI